MFLLDTNVVSEIRQIRLGTAHPSVALWAWADSVNAGHLCRSVINRLELALGIVQMERKDPRQGEYPQTLARILCSAGVRGA